MSSLMQPLVCRIPPILTYKKTRLISQIRCQVPRDHEGRSSRMVDANLDLLKVRMEEVRRKERLERCCVAEQGWNYASAAKIRTNIYQEMVVEFVEVVRVMGATLGFTMLACTLCLCIVSFLLHLNP